MWCHESGSAGRKRASGRASDPSFGLALGPGRPLHVPEGRNAAERRSAPESRDYPKGATLPGSDLRMGVSGPKKHVAGRSELPGGSRNVPGALIRGLPGRARQSPVPPAPHRRGARVLGAAKPTLHWRGTGALARRPLFRRVPEPCINNLVRKAAAERRNRARSHPGSPTDCKEQSLATEASILGEARPIRCDREALSESMAGFAKVVATGARLHLSV